MTEQMKEFLTELADLMEKHDVEGNGVVDFEQFGDKGQGFGVRKRVSSPEFIYPFSLRDMVKRGR